MKAFPLHSRFVGVAVARWLSVATAFALVLGVQGPAHAQQGLITGRVTDRESREPLSGVVVELVSGLRTLRSATTGNDGQFQLTGVSSGRYSLVFSSLGYETLRRDGISVQAGGTTALGNVQLVSVVFKLNPVVVTASREQEKALDAPASVYTVDTETIAQRPATTAVEHIRSVPGLDVASSGLHQNVVVARGFNNIFSGALFVLTDNRWASVPSLRFNAYNLIPSTNEDIERIELVLGPGSALYGPNVDKGVMHIITRSPLTHQGTTVSLVGGERELFQGTFRHSGLATENVGYKISGMYFRGRDWVFNDVVEDSLRDAAIDAGADEDQLLIGARDFDAERITGDARLDFRVGEEGTVVLSGGLSHMRSSIELTGLGGAQADKWTYSYVQARFRVGDLFAQSYVNFSDAGDSYLLRTGTPVSDNSLLYVGQVQHGTSLSDRQRFIYGADLIRTVPRTQGTIHGGNEDEDDITEVGGYVQSETALSPMLDLVLAGRLDYHSVVDEVVISPRAALVFKPSQEHSLRATYNRAFSQPTSVNLFLDLESVTRSPTQPFAVNGSGVPETGFTFRRDAAGNPLMRTFWADLVPNVSEADFLPLDATLLWPVAVGVLAQRSGCLQSPPPSTCIDLSALPPPTAAEVGTQLRALNQTTGAFDDVAVSSVKDIASLEPTITNIFELGYKGLIGSRVLLGLDVYYTKIQDFIGPLRTETPTAFLNRADLEEYLTPFLGPGAGTVAALMAGSSGSRDTVGIPLATVSPQQTTANNPADILLTYRQFGDVELWGADFGATIIANDFLSFSGSYSFASDKLFENLDGVGDIALNAPQNKASVAARFKSERAGLQAEVRGRYVDSFPVQSGVYEGTVSAYTVFDASASWALPISRSTEVTVTATNVFDNRHDEIVGAPQIGRLLLLRVRQSF